MNAFVLGSGFSASVGLPTVSGLYKAIHDIKDSYDDPVDFRRLHVAFQQIYGRQFETAGHDDNFEDFISQMHVFSAFEDRDDEGTGFFPTGEWSNRYKSAIFIVSAALSEREREVKLDGDTALRKFVSDLNDEDVIITYNWDTLVERQLRAMNRRFTMKPNIANGIRVLKMHGSLSWVKLSRNTSEHRGDNILQSLDGRSGLFASRDDRYTNPKYGLGEFAYIITPTLLKNPLELPFMRRLWTSAHDALRHSTSVSFIGISFSQADLHARGLMRSALDTDRKNVTVINPAKETPETYMALLKCPFIWHEISFDGSIPKRGERVFGAS